uniref:Cytochrome P450 n=1 Tax=Stomoxys calcitrans TaxID=35570 RepID=A0A1I8NQW6_STOCA
QMFILSLSFVLLTSIVLLLVAWCKRTYTFWQRHNIPYVKPLPIIGTLKDVLTMKKNVGVHINEIYNDPVFAKEPVVGIYMLHQPALLIRDPELIKSMFVKNFQNFHDRYATVDVSVDPFGALNMFLCKYGTWNKMRPKFSPTFTSGKLKQTFPLMVKVAQNLEKFLVKKGNKFVLEVRELCGLYTTDQISTIAFGIQAHSFDNFNNTANMFSLQNQCNIKERPTYKIVVMLLLPRLAKLFRAELFTKKYQNFLRTSLNNIIEERKRSGVIRNDLIDTLIKLRQEAEGTIEESEKQTYDDTLLAQANVFYLAGYETSLSFLSYTLYLLAKHPKVQKRLREEIKCCLENENGHVTYESLQNIPYMDMVMQESLRLYPVVSFLEREHNCDDPVLGKFSLKPHHDFDLPGGMPIFVSTLGMHNDPKYWDNPEVFDPERFAPGKPIPSAYMPYGAGPHNCIGGRLAKLQSKLGFIHILKNFEMRSCSKTVEDLRVSSNTISLVCEDDIHLEFVKDVLWEQ